ncbi:MAG: hypothetical protein ACE5LH_00175 [Fidelibacterota bacterium]
MSRPFLTGTPLIATALLFTPLWGIGTSFLTVPSTPRELALGGSSVIVMGDPSLSRGNPALVVQDLPSTQVYLGYHRWLTGIKGSSIFWVQPGLAGTVGVGIRQLAVSDLELRTDVPTDEYLAHFAASGTAVEVVWGKPLGRGMSGRESLEGGRIRFGMALRWIRTELYTYSSSGVGADIGAVWPVIPERFTVGAAVKNLGTMGPLNRKRPSLPTAVAAAASYRISPPETSRSPAISSMIMVETELSRAHGVVARVAGETGMGGFTLTLGSRLSRRLMAVGAGVAVTWRRFQVSYGMEVGSHRLGIPHLFQVRATLP